MSFKATAQADSIFPPRRWVTATASGVLALAVDGTARSYAISLLPLDGKAITSPGSDHIYVTLLCETADVYFAFGAATAATLDDTAVVAAAAALSATSMLATMPWRLVKDQPQSFRIDRALDTFLQVKCAGSGTATLRMYASSQSEK